MKEEHSDIQAFPFVVGVTGHRDMDSSAEPGIRKQVRDELLELKKLAGPETPVVLLSMLAKGADCLAAQIALELDIGLIAVLPMPAEEYEKDFETQDSLREMRTLLQASHRCFVLPLDSQSSGDIQTYSGDMRNMAYLRAGQYIVDHCHLLLALWDGAESNGPGGTAEIVEYALGQDNAGISAEGAGIHLSSARKVIQILTPRSSGTKKTMRLDKGTAYSQDTDSLIWKRLVRQTARFNKLIQKHRDSMISTWQNSLSYIPELESDTGHQTLRRYFAAADTLAIYLKQKMQRVFLIYFVCIMISSSVLMIFFKGGLPAYWNTHILLPVYLSAVAVALATYAYSRKTEIKNHSLDSRALAEALRIQMFWRRAGVCEEVGEHYLHIQREDLRWILFVLKGIHGQESPVSENISPEQAFSAWIMDQSSYYNRSADIQSRRHTRINAMANTALALGLLYVPLRAVSVPLYNITADNKLIWLLLVSVTVLSGLALSLWGSLRAYISFTGLQDQVRQYRAFQALFKRAGRRLETALDQKQHDTARSIFLTVGQEALAEHANWLQGHRSRQIGIPS